MKLSIAEIIDKAGKEKTKAKKISVLHEYDSMPLKIVLRLTYDKNIEFLLPETAPPWKKNEYTDVEGMLYKEARRLRIFFKGGGYDNLKQVKREQLFISLLEDIDNADADVLCQMLTHKPFKGLTEKLLEEAFPALFTMQMTMEQQR